MGQVPPPPRGAGPGAIAPDGSAVELYLKFPYRGELDTLAPYLPSGCSVLELGCGVGRLTRPLLAKGHAVTAVDNSPEMLLHVPDAASKVLCDIERLELRRTFDVVLLASNLINTSNDALRSSQLAACRRHVAGNGSLLFERLDPDWLCRAGTEAFPSVGDIDIEVERAPRVGRRVAVSVQYRIGNQRWEHHFVARVLEEDEVRGELRRAGFCSLEWVTPRWGVALP